MVSSLSLSEIEPERFLKQNFYNNMAGRLV